MSRASGRSLDEAMDDRTRHRKGMRGSSACGWNSVLATTAVAMVGALAGCASGASPNSPASTVLPPRCPQHGSAIVRARAFGSSGWAAAHKQLAPAGSSTIRLCRYAGRPHIALVSSRLLGGRPLVAGLVRELDRLPAFPAGPVNCPNDNGSQILALIAYPGHALTISVDLTGCRLVTNGSVGRTAAGMGSPAAFGPQLVTPTRAPGRCPTTGRTPAVLARSRATTGPCSLARRLAHAMARHLSGTGASCSSSEAPPAAGWAARRTTAAPPTILRGADGAVWRSAPGGGVAGGRRVGAGPAARCFIFGRPALPNETARPTWRGLSEPGHEPLDGDSRGAVGAVRRPGHRGVDRQARDPRRDDQRTRPAA